MNRLDNSPLFVALFIFTLISYLFSTLAFIVSQWYSMFPGSMSEFQNIGLWEICFNSFMYEEIYDKLFSDCFYISSTDISDLHNWIVTNWFLACQIIYTLSYLSLMVAALICTLMSFGLMNMRLFRNVTVLIVLHCIAWVTCFATLIIFGINTKNMSEYTWMPKPTQCTLSWSYGSASLSLLATMISLGLLFFVLKSKRKSYVSWGCGKDKMDQQHFSNQIELESVHTWMGPSIYDPRGTSSASKISAERDRSLISSRVASTHHTVKKENQPENSHQLHQKRSHVEKFSKFMKNNSRANVPKYIPGNQTNKNPSQSPLISDKPSSSLYSKNSKQASQSNTSLASEKIISELPKPIKISSPTASQLTLTSKNQLPSSSIVIAAKPMKKN